MKHILSVLVISVIFCFANNGNAQPLLTPLYSNPVIKTYLDQHPAARMMMSPTDPVDLPFADDFSKSSVYPDTSWWTDNMVFINSSFPRNPVTIGVATFDGLNADGDAYVNNNPLASGSCDTLTSRPIYLLTRPSSSGGGQYSAADSIRLSFFYEKKGWGDTPDPTDSLVLEFFNPTMNAWAQKWFATGGLTAGQDTIFYPVTVVINDTAYFKDGFRFRFRNSGSQTGALDQWHLDYVRLYKALNVLGQMDTVLRDVAMIAPGQSILQNYTSIPWDHFNLLNDADQANLLRDSIVMTYNNYNSAPQDIGFNNRIYNFDGSYVEGYGADNGNIFAGIQPNVVNRYAFDIDTVLPYSPCMLPDTNEFTVLNYFSNANSFEGIRSNDTTRYLQGFYNYYSYDDGTAEAGFDLVSAPNGKLAMRFDLIRPDTLRALRIFFVQQNQSVSNLLFTIKIWSSLSPETVIYQESNNRPVYTGSINGYSTYVLDQLVPVSGTIYVGFQQIASNGLHLGYDRNTNSNTKMFYNIAGSWSNVSSVIPGSFMLRPVMGDSTLFVGVDELHTDHVLNIYPVPASEYIRIRYTGSAKPSSVIIHSADGRLISNQIFSEEISVAALADGFYILSLQQGDGSLMTRSFVVRH